MTLGGKKSQSQYCVCVCWGHGTLSSLVRKDKWRSLPLPSVAWGRGVPVGCVRPSRSDFCRLAIRDLQLTSCRSEFSWCCEVTWHEVLRFKLLIQQENHLTPSSPFLDFASLSFSFSSSSFSLTLLCCFMVFSASCKSVSVTPFQSQRDISLRLHS